jgi:hypothetical protein
MFLFYTLMCRNYQEYKWKPCWSQIGTFQKSIPKLFSKMVTLQVEDGIKRKTPLLQSCREFHGIRSRHKIHLIPNPDGRDKPAPMRPKMGRRESERLYKRRNPSLWETSPPTNLQPPEPCFSLPHGSHLHGGGLPWSHEGRGLRGGAPPWCRRRGRSLPRPRPRRCCHVAAARALAAPLHHLHRYLHHICSDSSSHTPLYRPM